MRRKRVVVVEWLHDWPTALGAAFVVAGFVVPALVGSVLLQPIVGRLLAGEKDPNTQVGLLFSAFTLYYGVLLALLSIAVYGKAQDTISREASSVIALYRDLGGYPEPVRTNMIGVLRRYVDEETGPGWRDQRLNRASAPGLILVDDLSRLLLSFRPDRQIGEDILHQETLRAFAEFVDRRRMRIQAAGTSIPSIIWYVVLIGAVLNVFVLWLFEFGRTTHLILSGVLALFVGSSSTWSPCWTSHFVAFTGSNPMTLLLHGSKLAPADGIDYARAGQLSRTCVG